MNLSTRLHTSERLDNLSLSGQTLEKTLGSLRLINSLFGNHRQVFKAITAYYKQFPDAKIIRIVDLGCGGGDLIRILSKKLTKKGILVSFTGIDGNPSSVAIARSMVTEDHIHFETANILHPDFRIPECDILLSSHFIYHFEDHKLLQFLHTLKQQRIPFIIFSELSRSPWAYWLFSITKELLPISKMAKQDGLLAIKRAFTIPELEDILRKSPFTHYTISKKPWFRTITKITNIC